VQPAGEDETGEGGIGGGAQVAWAGSKGKV